MDRTSLEQLLDQGLSLAEIGRRFGRHEATVGYWVKKHGLQAANHDKHVTGAMLAQDELKAFVDAGMSIAQIAVALERSKGSIRHWLGKYKLNTRNVGGGPGRQGAREARAAGIAETILSCPRHGTTVHVRDSRNYFRCRICRQQAVVRRRRKVKQLLVEEAGGRCRLCGYDLCLAALEFHHLDPQAKEFAVSRRGAHSIERLREEVRKCILLCSNCHAEVESGFGSVSGVAQVDDPG
jgi:transposase